MLHKNIKLIIYFVNFKISSSKVVVKYWITYCDSMILPNSRKNSFKPKIDLEPQPSTMMLSDNATHPQPIPKPDETLIPKSNSRVTAETIIPFANCFPVWCKQIALSTFDDIINHKIERSPIAVSHHMLKYIFLESFNQKWETINKSSKPHEIISLTLSILKDMNLIEKSE